MIEKKVHRYSSLDSGSLCRLMRDDVTFISGQYKTNPAHIMKFIDQCLASPGMFFMGRDPRFEAFIMTPLHNMYTYSCHIAVREDKRKGTGVALAAAEAAKIIMTQTDCRNLIAFIPENKRLSQILCAAGGFRRIGRTSCSYSLGQETYGEIIYEMTVEDWNNRWAEKLGGI